MDRKQSVYWKLKEYSDAYLRDETEAQLFQNVGIEAEKIAFDLGIDRSGVSRILNEMVSAGAAIKSNGRPVRFITSEVHEKLTRAQVQIESEKNTAFDCLIGAEYSLKDAIDQAKAAVIYPPRGLHTFLIGPTGIGKSLFAEQMYQYAKEEKIIGEDGRFVVFNCAEYVENPQLLLAQLFGHVKGAFTGADKETTGLVEAANHGILFLDEIHRLPKEGQEMLFLVLDKGVYSKLGETAKKRKVDVLMIGATTEDIDTYIIKTFLRRVPMIITLPALKTRSTEERLMLIENFFAAEMQEMNVPIRLHKDVLTALMCYECKGNVGQLKSDIKKICAKAFLKRKIFNTKIVTIEAAMLPEEIRMEHYGEKRRQKAIVEFVQELEKYYLIVQEGSGKGGELERRFRQFSKKRSRKNDKTLLDTEVANYINQLENEGVMLEDNQIKGKLLEIINERVYEASEEALRYAEYYLGKKLSKRIRTGFMIHVNLMLDRIKSNLPFIPDAAVKNTGKHTREYKIAVVMVKMLESEFDISIPAYEIDHLVRFFLETENNKKKIGIIVLAHGSSTASSMLEVSQKLLGVNHGTAIDMPYEQTAMSTLEIVEQQVQAENQGNGVLLLTDMGSLTTFAETISEKTGIDVRSISMVTTLTVIEALRKAELAEMNVGELARELEQLPYFYQEKVERQKQEERIIITTCMTGKGTAVQIQRLIEKELDEGDSGRITIMPLSYAEQLPESVYDKNVLAVVGTVDLGIPGVPFISVDEFILDNGRIQLYSLMNHTSIQTEENKKIEGEGDELVVSILGWLLNFLDREPLAVFLERAYLDIVNLSGLRETKEQKIRFISHVGCMVERLMRKEVLPFCDNENMLTEHEGLTEQIQHALASLCEFYSIQLPPAELAYIVELFCDA